MSHVVTLQLINCYYLTTEPAYVYYIINYLTLGVTFHTSEI